MPSRATRATASMFRRPLRRDEMLPEFRAVRKDPAAAARGRVARKMLRACERLTADPASISPVPYTLFTEYDRLGVRTNFDHAYFRRRSVMSAAALLTIFRRERRWIDLLQDAVWSTCEETTWVPPEHRTTYPIDLFSAETAFALAELSHLLGDVLDEAVRARLRNEVERRILEPFLDTDWTPWWADGHNNWSGVCYGSVGSAFLYLEPDPARLAKAVNHTLAGLERFIERAFLPDGGSSEGAGYWQYGLIHVVAFSELLRRRTRGAVDFLSHEKFRRIARYPLAAMVAPGEFYSCSDCRGTLRFSPGFIARLARRSGTGELTSLLSRNSISAGPGKLPCAVRDILWWDGALHRRPILDDRMLPDTAVVRLTGPKGLVVMAKAGHNAENHNQNDVGSFALYAKGDALLCDPGAGVYDKWYFGPKRYDNPVCSSYGHCVPRIGGRTQGTGRRRSGAIVAFEHDRAAAEARIEFAGAYGVRSLRTLDRRLGITKPAPSHVELEDRFAFTGKPPQVEEAFVTWNPVSVRGGTARIHGKEHVLSLRVLDPSGAVFRVEDVPVAVMGANGSGILRRITCRLPKGTTSFRMQMTVPEGS